MRLSHILYKVENLHEAVQAFRDMGFTVEYGSAPEKASNAMIWFEEGPFLELFAMPSNKLLIKILTSVLRVFGKSNLMIRVKHYAMAEPGFCDWSIETDDKDLSPWMDVVEKKGYKCDLVKAKRTSVRGEKLFWQLGAPPSMEIPFLMSAYNIDQRPQRIVHENGAKSIEKITVRMDSRLKEFLETFVEDERLNIETSGREIDVIFEGLDRVSL